MKINCIIIEDEPLALKRTKAYVERMSYLNLLQTFDNGFEALGFLKTHAVDLLFLDIKMDELSGIQLLESLEKKPFVIITTAYDEYALKGFELNVTDYLLKPFSIERFIQAVEKVFLKINKPLIENRDFFFVKSDYKIEKIFFKDILFIEGMRDFRSIHMQTKRLLTSQTFSELESDLPVSNFCRVHKSYLVALDKIERIEKNRIKINEVYIPIGELFKESFYMRIGFGAKGK